jgi:hypothetical protein
MSKSRVTHLHGSRLLCRRQGVQLYHETIEMGALDTVQGAHADCCGASPEDEGTQFCRLHNFRISQHSHELAGSSGQAAGIVVAMQLVAGRLPGNPHRFVLAVVKFEGISGLEKKEISSFSSRSSAASSRNGVTVVHFMCRSQCGER